MTTMTVNRVVVKRSGEKKIINVMMAGRRWKKRKMAKKEVRAPIM